MRKPGTPLLLPNPWNIGSPIMLTHLGSKSVATTSAGYAYSVGRLDGQVERNKSLGHFSRFVNATELPVNVIVSSRFSVQQLADDGDFQFFSASPRFAEPDSLSPLPSSNRRSDAGPARAHLATFCDGVVFGQLYAPRDNSENLFYLDIPFNCNGITSRSARVVVAATPSLGYSVP